VHGLGNKLLCALWAGASVMFCPPSPPLVWQRLRDAKKHKLTLFMAVPTNYALLLREFDSRGGHGCPEMKLACDGAKQLRLMVSGSAALPAPLLHRWKAATVRTQYLAAACFYIGDNTATWNLCLC